MSRVKIPATEKITCDFCGKDFGDFSTMSEITIEIAGNWIESGESIRPTRQSFLYDTCNDCYMKVADLMKERIE